MWDGCSKNSDPLERVTAIQRTTRQDLRSSTGWCEYLMRHVCRPGLISLMATSPEQVSVPDRIERQLKRLGVYHALERARVAAATAHSPEAQYVTYHNDRPHAAFELTACPVGETEWVSLVFIADITSEEQTITWCFVVPSEPDAPPPSLQTNRIAPMDHDCAAQSRALLELDDPYAALARVAAIDVRTHLHALVAGADDREARPLSRATRGLVAQTDSGLPAQRFMVMVAFMALPRALRYIGKTGRINYAKSKRKTWRVDAIAMDDVAALGSSVDRNGRPGMALSHIAAAAAVRTLGLRFATSCAARRRGASSAAGDDDRDCALPHARGAMRAFVQSRIALLGLSSRHCIGLAALGARLASASRSILAVYVSVVIVMVRTLGAT